MFESKTVFITRCIFLRHENQILRIKNKELVTKLAERTDTFYTPMSLRLLDTPQDKERREGRIEAVRKRKPRKMVLELAIALGVLLIVMVLVYHCYGGE